MCLFFAALVPVLKVDYNLKGKDRTARHSTTIIRKDHLRSILSIRFAMPFIYYRLWAGRSQPLVTSGKRRGTPRTGCLSVAGLTQKWLVVQPYVNTCGQFGVDRWLNLYVFETAAFGGNPCRRERNTQTPHCTTPSTIALCWKYKLTLNILFTFNNNVFSTTFITGADSERVNWKSALGETFPNTTADSELPTQASRGSKLAGGITEDCYNFLQITDGRWKILYGCCCRWRRWKQMFWKASGLWRITERLVVVVWR